MEEELLSNKMAQCSIGTSNTNGTNSTNGTHDVNNLSFQKDFFEFDEFKFEINLNDISNIIYFFDSLNLTDKSIIIKFVNNEITFSVNGSPESDIVKKIISDKKYENFLSSFSLTQFMGVITPSLNQHISSHHNKVVITLKKNGLLEITFLSNNLQNYESFTMILRSNNEDGNFCRMLHY